MNALSSYLSAPGFLPHGYCLLWRPDLLALHAGSDVIIAAAYFSIPLAILAFLRRRVDLVAEHRLIALLFSTFILGCGLTHVMGVVVLWRPLYLLDGQIKAFTALVSIITAFALWPMLPRLLAIPSPGQLAAANAKLVEEVAAKNRAVEELRAIRAGLESEVRRRVAQAEALAKRLEIATEGSLVTVFEQDADLRYTWMHNPRPPLGEAALGQTDSEALEPGAAEALAPIKRQVLSSGERLRTEVALPVGGREHHFAMTLTPVGGEAEPRGLLVASIDITEQKRQEERQAVIARELAHRAKNVLALVEGIARQTAKSENLPPSVVANFSKRLAALGRAQDLLVHTDWEGIELGDLIRAQLTPLLPRDGRQVVIEGPPGVLVSAEVGQYLSLALHELATNAFKYGALGQADGRLEVRWRAGRDAPDGYEIGLEWIEHGGAAPMPERKGFGRLLLETILPRALQGWARLEFGPEGVIWRSGFDRRVAKPAAG
ncbi:HWE histidine kinase domain-containing protein [Phenylobacterium montanum]|uniref:histidine kinase n=1 Tax=Phenylobacterium montanum TaxID=2823693 RepID=A0A975FY27_9CAUL|nr:HWE histidine kinase domain-containing protein [Caulobacter sp. S6]QUD86937.1 PAS domain-containing protein [Caulobacter sp. S6]